MKMMIIMMVYRCNRTTSDDDATYLEASANRQGILPDFLSLIGKRPSKTNSSAIFWHLRKMFFFLPKKKSMYEVWLFSFDFAVFVISPMEDDEESYPE